MTISIETAAPERWRQPARLATLAILALAYVLVLVADLPGHMTYDSVVQLSDGRNGTYHLWHPPVMAWLLGLFDRVHRGTALFVIANAGLLFGSLAAMVWTRPRVSWLAALVAAVMAMSPLVLIYQGIVWKDVLFANATVSGFLWLSIGTGLSGGRRIASVVGAVLLLSIAALTRQNGLLVLPIGAIALGWGLVRRDGRAALGRAIGVGLIALVAGVALVEGAQAYFTAHKADQAGSAEELRTIQMFDIVGALSHDPSIDLSPFGPNAAKIRAALKAYTPTRVDTLVDLDGVDAAITAPQQVPAVWRDVVLHHTRAYLAQRADAFWWTFSPPKVELCLPIDVGVDGDKDLLSDLHMPPRFSSKDKRLVAYAKPFYHTPVFSHLTYAVLALIFGVLLLRSKAAADAPILLLLVAMGAFTASFVLITLACDYRYLYALDLTAMTVGLYLACAARGPAMAKPAA